MTYVVVHDVATDSKSNHRIILLCYTFHVEFDQTVDYYSNTVAYKCIHSEYNDSLGAHNFFGSPSSSGGGPIV